MLLKVSYLKFNEAISKLESASKNMGDYLTLINEAKKSLNLLSGTSGFQRNKRVESLCNDILQHQTDIKRLSDTLSTIRQEYITCDEMVLRLLSVTMAQVYSREKRTAVKAAFGVVSDLFSGLSGIVSLPYHLLTGDSAAVMNDGWKIINSVYTTGEDLVALSLLAISVTFFDDKKARLAFLESAEDYEKRKGLTDELKSASSQKGDVFDSASKVTKTVDVASDIYGVYKGAKDLSELGDKIVNEDIDTWDVLGELGYKNPDQSPDPTKSVDELFWKQQSSTLSNAKTTYGYAKALGEGEIGKELLENTTIGSMNKKVTTLMDDVEDLTGISLGGGNRGLPDRFLLDESIPPSAERLSKLRAPVTKPHPVLE